MARMIPPYLSDDVKSAGDRQTFTLFRDSVGTEKWIVLHSLSLSKVAQRRYGEVDFVIIAPGKGVFAVEVKTGKVNRHEGVWEFTDRYGNINKKTRGPFEQARDGMFAVRTELIRKLGYKQACSNTLYAFFVMFFEYSWYEDDLDHESWQVYNAEYKTPIADFMDLLVENEKQLLSPSVTRAVLSEELAKQFAFLLRRNYEQFVTQEQVDTNLMNRIHSFTEEQYVCLDQMEDNLHCLFLGGAGTGKTVLAMEAARRESFDGKRVLLTCYNTPLADWISTRLLKESKCSNLTIMGFHALMRTIVGTIPGEEPDSNWFENVLPNLVLSLKNQLEKYDVLIVDEAQDLCIDQYLDVMDALLIGGLVGGKWRMFGDFYMQSLYTRTDEVSAIEYLSKRSAFVTYKLLVNCRNTRQIFDEIKMISSVPARYYKPPQAEGIAVSWHFTLDHSKAESEIAVHVRHLMDNGVTPANIVILSKNKPGQSIQTELERQNIPYRLPRGAGWDRNTGIRLSTIHRFKGLEARYIIIEECREAYGSMLLRRLSGYEK